MSGCISGGELVWDMEKVIEMGFQQARVGGVISRRAFRKIFNVVEAVVEHRCL